MTTKLNHTIKCFVIQHNKKYLKHKMTYKYKSYVTMYNNNCNTYITSPTCCMHIFYILFWFINNSKSYHIFNVIMIILMMIYDDTHLYIVQPVAVNFILCDVECIICRWRIKNRITMYATEIGNSYIHIFFIWNSYQII